MGKMIDSIDHMLCTGCKMCADLCPVDAISYANDHEGFWYPSVDYKKCIGCRKCLRTCPSLNDRINPASHKPMVYAAYNIDDKKRISSTSGGLYYALAEKMLEDGGVITGSVYTDNYRNAVQIVGTTQDDLERLKGSKYFQSDTAGIYKKTKKLLDNGRKVLFCGAPCHVAGLNAYLGISNDNGASVYPNLVTVDFVCRGINSPKVFRKYVEDCEKRYGAPVTRVHLKNKNKGWMRLGTYIEFANGKTYYRDYIDDPWVNGFVVGNLFMRPACSKCLYKEEKRVADISLGDFWGLLASEKNLYKGISLVLINTDKGEQYFNSVKEKLMVSKQTYETAVRGNGCLLTSAPMGDKREEFFKRLDSEPYEDLVWDLIGRTKIQTMKMRVIAGVRRILHKIKNRMMVAFKLIPTGM